MAEPMSEDIYAPGCSGTQKQSESTLNPPCPVTCRLCGGDGYFRNITQLIENIVDSSNDYSWKVLNLITVWSKCVEVLSSLPCSGTLTFMQFSSNYSAKLILDPRWEKIPDSWKNKLVDYTKKISLTLKNGKSHVDSYNISQFFLSLIKYPWSHHHIEKILYGNPTQEEVFSYIEYENGNMFTLRLKMLYEEKCDSEALQLASLAVNLYLNEPKSKSYIKPEDFELIIDIYYVCLEKMNKRNELINHIMKLSLENGYNLLNRYCKQIENMSQSNKSTINKYMQFIFEITATLLVSSSIQDRDISFFSKILKKWCIIMHKLAEFSLQPNIDYKLRIKNMVHKFTYLAPKSDQIYLLCDSVINQFGSTLPLTLYIEMYIKALTLNINEKAKFKALGDRNKLFESLKNLVQGYLKMANTLEDILSICRECVLTAYSLMPSIDLMTRIEHLAVKSGKLKSENLISVHTNVCDKDNDESIQNIKTNSKEKPKRGRPKSFPKPFKYNKKFKPYAKMLSHAEYFTIISDLRKLPDPLTLTMQENLISVLKYPRFGLFNWSLDWENMKKMCQQYLDNLDLVLKRNTLIHSDLKFLDIDIEEYNKANEIHLKYNFSSDYSDNESTVSDDSSEEFVCYSEKRSKIRSKKRKSTRKRKFGSRKRKNNNSKKRKASSRKQSKSNPRKKLKTENEFKLNVDLPVRRSSRTRRNRNVDKTEYLSNHEKNPSIKPLDTNVISEIDDNSNSLIVNENNEFKNHKTDRNENKNLHQNIPRQKRIINKNQHKDFDYSWCLKKKPNKSLASEVLEKGTNTIDKRTNDNKSKSNNINLTSSTNVEFPHSTDEHLSMLSERVPQLSSLDFIRPINTDHIINVAQIQVTSNTHTNVSQTQTEHVTNHSANEIEKKDNDNQTNTNSLDNFVSMYQPNSINNSTNSIQNSGIPQGECSFTGSVSVSNQRITTDSITSIHNIGQQETNKPLRTNDLILDQNQINLEHSLNDTQLQNSSEQLSSTIENSVHLSSNVIVRTSDVVNPSNIIQTTGNMTNTVKKSPYCVKTRDQFIDLSLPASISSTSTNNRSTNILATMKNQKITPVQTSVGLQVNFNRQRSEDVLNMNSPNNLQFQIRTSVAQNSISTNMSILNDQIINSINNGINTSSSVPIVNPVSSIQTQTCIGLQASNEVSNPNTSVISLISSSPNHVKKTNVHSSLYTSPQNQRVQLNDLSHLSQTNRSDEQKKIDSLKLLSQTFTATSEAIKFVTSNTESQNLIQSTEKNNALSLAVFQNTADNVTNISQENESCSKILNRVLGNTRTYESKTKTLKQTSASDDLVMIEKGTLYAVHDDSSSQTKTPTHVRIQFKNSMDLIEKQKPTDPSPNITITGSMLPRFQQVFGKTKFQSSNIIDTTPICTTSVASTSPNPGPIVNRTNITTSRVYSSSKGVQTSHEIDPISSIAMRSVSPKVVDNKSQHNMNLTKGNNVKAIMGNNKNNVIMTCKTVSALKTIPQGSESSNHQLLTCNIGTNNVVKKEITGIPISKVSTTYTTSCNSSSIVSSSSNVIYSIPIQSDSKVTNTIEKPSHDAIQIQRQLKMSPSIIQTVLRKHPNWQQNSFRQGKQNTEVQSSSTVERLISSNVSNIVKTINESLNNKISVSTNKPNLTDANVSSLMMEQVREFESVLEEVRKTSLMNEMSTASMLPQINHEIIQIHSPTENDDLLNTDSNQTLFPLNKKCNMDNERDRCSFSFLNQTLSNDLASEEKEPVTVSPTLIPVRSVTPIQPITSPNNVPVSPIDGSIQCPKQIVNKVKPIIKTPASSPSTSAVKVPVLQKPLPKLQEDEQTTQRIYAILDKYAEQLRNSPELKNKPAPRRRTNPPTNPSLNAKRKKTNHLNVKTCSQQTSCSSSGMEMSPTSDMQAIDSEDSSNAVSHFSHIINSPSRNSDEQTAGTVISEAPLIENTLINVNDVIKKINVDADIKSKVTQSTQIVVGGATGPFLSIPEGSTGNVRLLVSSGKNPKMFRLHCPVSGSGSVLFHQISTKDSCPSDIKMSSNILGQSIHESTILSALTAENLQITNTGLGNDILLNTSENSTVFDHKINKSDIILESMEKAQVLENNEKQLPYPVMKKSQASQSMFSVIHTLPCKSNLESNDNIEMLSEVKNNISENIQKNYCGKEHTISNLKQDFINKSNIDKIGQQFKKLNKTIKEDPSFIRSESSKSTSISFDDIEFSSFHSQEGKQENNKDLPSSLNEKSYQQNLTNLNDKHLENTINNQISIDCINDNKMSNNPSSLHIMNCNDGTIVKTKESSNNITEDVSNTIKEDENKSKPNVVLSDVTSDSAVKIISTANQTSNTYKQNEELSSKTVKAEFESENENESTLSNTVYNMLDNQSVSSVNTKIGSLIFRLKSDWSAKNWNNCLSKLMPPGTEKILEGDHLTQLQKSFQHTTIKTYKDLKMFVFEQCKQFDNNVETSKEYDLYDDIDGLGVDKPSTNELFPEVAILNDLDKSISPTLGLLQASTSKLCDNTIHSRRKSVLSHTTTSTVSSIGIEQTTNIVCKKNKTKVSFLKQALYNEMNQDSNDSETKSFINGSNKNVLESIEQQIDSSPESPSNTTAVDSETCMSEDSTSTISSGTPHYNFRKSKRKYVEEDECRGFIESQVIKRMYRGRTSEDGEEKTDLPKLNHSRMQSTDQKQLAIVKKEGNNRRISSRLKNNVKNVSMKSPQMDSTPNKATTTRSSLRRVSRKTT